MNGSVLRGVARPTAWGVAAAVMMGAAGTAAAGAGIAAASAEAAGAALSPSEAFRVERFVNMAVGEWTSVESLAIGDVENARAGSMVGTLDLQRFTVLSPDARVVVADGAAERPADLEGLTLLRGSVRGDLMSRVFVAVSARQVSGQIAMSDGRVFSISTGPDAGAGPVLDNGVVIAEASTLVDQVPRAPFTCDVREAPVIGPLDAEDAADQARRGVLAPRAGTCGGAAAIAVDTDWEFTRDLFSGNPDAAAQYAVALIGAVSEIYQRDVSVELSVPFVRTWAADTDPYVTTSNDLLPQVQAHWTAEMRDVSRAVVHLLSGRTDTPYGGVAYLSALCDTGSGFGVSAYLNGFFPFPIPVRGFNTWDLIVVAHELGHNFGTGHTHDGYVPVIDRCGIDCTGNRDGTIMSYCHICPGGLNNVKTQFHPRVIEKIEQFVIGRSCVATINVVPLNDAAETLREQSVLVDVLGNDSYPECVDPFIFNFDRFTSVFGLISIVNTPNAATPHALRYTPPAGFVGQDSFRYTTLGGGVATVTVQVGCPADLNGDGPVDIFDLFDFLAALDTGNAAVADVNRDEAIDIFDLFDFLALLDQGC